jgi:hypothetical protein
MFFSEKLQPWKSKWAEFKEMSFGYSMFSTCLGEEKATQKERQTRDSSHVT